MRLYSKYIKTLKTKKQKVYYLMFINKEFCLKFFIFENVRKLSNYKKKAVFF